ncbi:MAG: imelysin family protein [Saprospiraceae bacterium]|nr:imelysin family protein [Saprospiraceae bacterium]
MKFFPHLLVFICTALLPLTGCDSGGKEEPGSSFDRQAMLRHYADNLIKPSYTALLGRIETFKTQTSVFIANPTGTELSALQIAWAAAYTDWQYANAWNFGPSGEAGLKKGLVEEVGTFPAGTAKIESAVGAGQWNLEDFNRDARGFLAIEYLIYGQNQSADEVAALFAADAQRRDYLQALVNDLQRRISEVVNTWNSAYSSEFIQNDGTDVGSSISQLYNEFVRSYESIKNFKLGLPMGKRPGQTQAEPQLVEAYYSGLSLTMLKAHFAAVENSWYGRARNGQDGPGFREYLESVEGGNTLIAGTEAQLAALKSALAAVPESPALSEQIANNSPQLEALYVELSKMTRFFKSDLSSLLGIAITFSSGDGD